jgi:pSer/pThr/pTyr-binding forkhead associated (FHA) protein
MPMFLSPKQNGDPIKLDKAILLFGRHPGCDVVLVKSRKISRIHCCVAFAGERVLVRDLASTNGIAVNGKRVTETELKLGDELSVGDVQFSVLDKLPTKETAESKRQAVAAEQNGKSDYPLIEKELVKDPSSYEAEDFPVPELSDSQFEVS